jgi:glycosyltransferase involved in cell wall biosynthesis
LAGLIRRQVDIPVTVIPNGFSPAPRTSPPKRNLVLVVARLFPRKGVQHFLEAVKEMEGDWEFVIAGDGPYMDELQRQAMRIKSPVKFIGFVDKATLYDLYQQAKIFVFPSIRDNFPMVLLEAMEAGCAVITTDAEGCAEVVGNAGVTVESGSARQIEAELAALMAQPERCAHYSRLARERAELFRWPKIAARYRQVFRSVLHPEEVMRSSLSESISEREPEPSANVRRGVS